MKIGASDISVFVYIVLTMRFQLDGGVDVIGSLVTKTLSLSCLRAIDSEYATYQKVYSGISSSKV